MEIRICKSARTCLGCENDFVHDALIHSLVRASEEGLDREDFCESCWPGIDAKGAHSTWSTKFYDPRVADAEPEESFSPLRQLFYEAVDSEDRLELAKAFLAAQLLRRQKVFRLIKESDEQDGEIKILLYTDRIGNRLIEVRDPHFTYKELDEGRTRLITQLQELEAPEEAETPATEDAAMQQDEHAETEESAEDNPDSPLDAGAADDSGEENEHDDDDDDGALEDDEDGFDDDDDDDDDGETFESKDNTTPEVEHEHEARQVTTA